MFRKPRELKASVTDDGPILPSTGRPPTPPSSITNNTGPATAISTYSMASMTSTPMLGRSKTLPKRTPFIASAKNKGKGNGNGNIMSFFKKAESGVQSGQLTTEEEEVESLFLEDSPLKTKGEVVFQTPTPPRDDLIVGEVEDTRDEYDISRFNEDPVPSKRRKLEGTSTPVPERRKDRDPVAYTNGPFADDSDSDADLSTRIQGEIQAHGEAISEIDRAVVATTPPSESKANDRGANENQALQLKREATSIGEVNKFEGIEDFIDDEFPADGEEYMERRWMEEQAELEMGLEGDDQELEDTVTATKEEPLEAGTITPNQEESTVCPICGGSTTGMAEQVSRLVYPQIRD